MSQPKMPQDSRIPELLLRWEELRSPDAEPTAADLCKGCPELAAELERQIAAVKSMGWMNSPLAPGLVGDGVLEAIAHDVMVSQTIGRYELQSLVGAGGFGQVYRAFDPQLNRLVAVKIPLTRFARLQDPAAFLAEARKLAALKHPGIVQVYDVGQVDGRWFIVSEFVDGCNLAEWLGQGRHSHTTAAAIIAEVAEHLHYAHQQGLIHRDIKPANILIDKQGRPFLTDFGIALAEEDALADRDTRGTLAYMPPEQLTDHASQPDIRADIYSLGVVLYELLTGRLPFQTKTPGELREAALHQAPWPIRAIDQTVPVALERACLKCLAKNPVERYATAFDLAVDLRRFLKPKRRFPRAALPVAVGVAGLAALVAFAVTSLQSSRHSPTDGALRISPADRVQFHWPGLIYVLDPEATAILYSLDGKQWQQAERFQITGAAFRWAEGYLRPEDIDRLRVLVREDRSRPPRLMIRYLDAQGSPSEVRAIDVPDLAQADGALPSGVADAIEDAKKSIRGAKDQVQRLNKEFGVPHRDAIPIH